MNATWPKDIRNPVIFFPKSLGITSVTWNKKPTHIDLDSTKITEVTPVRSNLRVYVHEHCGIPSYKKPEEPTPEDQVEGVPTDVDRWQFVKDYEEDPDYSLTIHHYKEHFVAVLEQGGKLGAYLLVKGRMVVNGRQEGAEKALLLAQFECNPTALLKFAP